ncbi:MAG TPA: F420-0--gamma-glutamyl ligase [Clostridia bacterium]|nr:F420-0--gamma-glutamyl ligase [Clostridia bacterium]
MEGKKELIAAQALAIKTGLILPNDDISEVVADAVKGIAKDGDIVCVTEAVVARSQNRYVTSDELSRMIKESFKLNPQSTLAVVYPIASRNRFALVLKAIAMATEGGRVIVTFPIPADEVGNQIIDAEMARTRLGLKTVYKHLTSARGSTPHLNILIREVIAALILQSLGYSIVGMRKILGTGLSDITVKTPEGLIAPLEVTFTDHQKAAKKAVEILADMPEARKAFAAGVDLGRREFALFDALRYVSGDETPIYQISFADKLDAFADDEAIYSEELGNEVFKHPITGIDYRELYLDLIQEAGAKGDVIFTNNPFKVYELGYLDGIIIGEVHTRKLRRDLFLAFGAKVPVKTLDELGPKPWGVIGSNVSDYQKGLLKLLPEDADGTAEEIRERILEKTGKDVDVLIFGDGAYKDPDTGIYELADPYPSLGASERLRGFKLREGKKLKLAVDTLYNKGYNRDQIKEILEQKEGEQSDLGTTPRKLVSIAATLADLLAGSADQGTPIVLIRGMKRG